MSRDCVKAGTWYSNNASKLDGMMDNWLEGCKIEVDMNLKFKCLIGPHAGYRHCGATLARAFKNINPKGIRTVFIFGPSHKFRFKGCSLTSCNTYKTPFGNLQIDRDVVNNLLESKLFCDIGVRREENEHSIEMHLPFVYKIFGNKRIKIVPVMVSHFDEFHSADAYARVFHPYFKRNDVFFCVSSDFCHWGPRFRFTHKFSNFSNIGESIEHLDKLGVNAISSNSIKQWKEYLEKYKNTICGRRAISIVMEILASERKDQNGSFNSLEWKMVGYHQSNRNVTESETSVSYASCILYDLS